MRSAARCSRIEGDLEALSVAELVQTLALGRKTARMALRTGAQSGEMWFENGALLHAATGTLFGDLAVYSMIAWERGSFRIDYGVTSGARSITEEATFLVLEGLRRIDESAAAPQPVVIEQFAKPSPRRIVLACTAVGGIAGVVVLLMVLHGPSSAVPDVVAAMPPPVTIVSEPAPAPPRRERTVPRPRKTVLEEPVGDTLVAPVSPLAEEPVPLAVLAPAAIVEEPPAPAVEPATLLVSGTSGASRGTLTLLVDGVPVHAEPALFEDAPFTARIDVAPGEHEIVVRLELPGGAPAYEDSVRGTFASGESRAVRVTANRAIGAPVKLKLARPPRAG